MRVAARPEDAYCPADVRLADGCYPEGVHPEDGYCLGVVRPEDVCFPEGVRPAVGRCREAGYQGRAGAVQAGVAQTVSVRGEAPAAVDVPGLPPADPMPS